MLESWSNWLTGGLIGGWPQERAEVVYLAFSAAWAAGRETERKRVRAELVTVIAENAGSDDLLGRLLDAIRDLEDAS